MNKRVEDVDVFVSDLVAGMKVQVYNASGTLRFSITIERPTVFIMESERKDEANERNSP